VRAGDDRCLAHAGDAAGGGNGGGSEFADDFESGTFDAWGEVVAGPSNSWEVSAKGEVTNDDGVLLLSIVAAAAENTEVLLISMI